MFARLVRVVTALAVALVATARGAEAQIPPSIEFRVPKPPTVAMSDSGALIAYELHVTNLTAASMTLRRVEVLDADKHGHDAVVIAPVGGSFVGIDIGHGRYALYAHVQPGSLKVKVGDHVRRGQVIALLGNSGNSTEPHVHFQIADGPSFLSSEGLPYATDFDVVGRCGIDNGPPPAIKCAHAESVAVHGGIPLQNELVRFPK